MNQAKIFNIQSFSTTDGPGIRTVVFFQGCNLHCLWCHNPESIDMNPRVGFIKEKCIGCGNCATERNPEICFAGALIEPTRTFTPKQLWVLLKNDVLYYKNSNGGVTFSGGECMLHATFLAEIVEICRENGVHTAVDTAGHISYELLKKVNPDLFLFDVKASEPMLHKKLTGVDGKLIWNNLQQLAEDGYNVHVRIPCVPGANWKEIPEMIKRLKKIGITNTELLPYHTLGADKNSWYEKEAILFTPPTKEEMEKFKELL